MITIVEFAHIAEHMYHPNRNFMQRKNAAFKQTKSSIDSLRNRHGWYAILDIDPLVNPQMAFFAQLYVKFHHDEPVGAVIGIRGTDNIPNDMTDVTTWWESFFNNDTSINLPKNYDALLLSFYVKVRSFTKHQLGIPLMSQFITGHSLGGALAALATTYNKLPIRAVTFNAPGIRHIEGVNNYWDEVLNFRASYDFISAVDSPIGYTINLEVPEHYQQAKHAFDIARKHQRNKWSYINVIDDESEEFDFLIAAKAQHSMSNLLVQIEKHPIAFNIYGSFHHVETSAAYVNKFIKLFSAVEQKDLLNVIKQI